MLLHIAGDPDWVIFETNWMLCGEDLPWAQQSWEAIVALTQDLMDVAAAYDPAVIHLDIDLAESLRRARERDGDQQFAGWLDYMRNLPALQPWHDADALTLVTASGERIQRIWAAAGAQLLRVDAAGSRDAVLARALDALDARWFPRGG